MTMIKSAAAGVAVTVGVAVSTLAGPAMAWEPTKTVEFIVPAGSLGLTYSDQPYANATRSMNQDIHLRVLTIPAALCQPFVTSTDDLLARPLAAVPGIDALAISYFNSFATQAPHLTGPAFRLSRVHGHSSRPGRWAGSIGGMRCSDRGRSQTDGLSEQLRPRGG